VATPTPASTYYDADKAREEDDAIMAKYTKIETDIMLSHAWSKDGLGRDNHARVMKLAEALKMRGVVVWIDEEKMTGDVEDVMLM
jgi:hypothetical protein